MSTFSCYNSLRERIKNGDVSCLNNLMKEGATHILLNESIDSGHLDIVEALIDLGVDVNMKIDGEPILICAAGSGQLEVVISLVRAGANTCAVNDDWEDALLVAATNGYEEIFEYLSHYPHTTSIEEGKILLEEGVHYRRKKDNHHVENFVLAAGKGSLGNVQSYIDNGIDVNMVSVDGNTALYLATCFGHLPIVKKLVEEGADVNFKHHENDWTPLMIAARSGYSEVAEFLISHGANINAQDRFGRTADKLAGEFGYIELSNLLRRA